MVSSWIGFKDLKGLAGIWLLGKGAGASGRRDIRWLRREISGAQVRFSESPGVKMHSRGKEHAQVLCHFHGSRETRL